ncbi:MAG: methyltransferase domain-containing protein [Planctomycetota bacterium]|nr:methyltransferase domain-containing protein [Planctomycetota bacterium]
MSTLDTTRPSPLDHGDTLAFRDAIERGATFKTALEELLLALPEERADRTMQELRESRGAWFPLLRSSGGSLLFLGSSLSGTITPLAASGFEITVLDASAERIEFARVRNETHSPGRVNAILCVASERLAFSDQSFDVVVIEDWPIAPITFAAGVAEALRVARGEVVLSGENRLAYKHSSGKRSDFSIPSPVEYMKKAVSPKHGERTLRGYRNLLTRPGFATPRAFALYPHARDFTFVVGIDEPRPRLAVGPMERKNRIKLAAQSLGLFPVFTPSFALIGARSSLAKAPTRIERILMEIARRTGEPLPQIEQVVATRGNTALIHTSIPGSRDDEPRGRWTLHVPLCPKNIPQLELHYRSLELVTERFANVPVPKPILYGRVDGVWLTCERRLPGFTAPQVTSNRATATRLLADAARHFSSLVVRPAAEFTAADFEAEIGARFDLVATHAAVRTTIERLTSMRDACRSRFIGKCIPRVLYHADLRGKHVQVARDGSVLGYLDWGTTESAGLPYFDLLHLVIHEKKQQLGATAERAWKSVRDRTELLEHEERALAHYRSAVGLDDDTARAIEEIYPVLVAAMAEKNWDYSRPCWLHRQFGL